MNNWIDPENRVDRAHELYKEGRWREAADELREAIRLDPHNASWHFNLGLTLEAMEEYALACKAFESALQLQPEDVETLNCLGVNLTRIGKYAEALEHLEEIERLDPTYEPCYCNRIVTYTEIGRHDDAEVMFYTARLFSDECPSCYFNIGNSFMERDQLARAIDCWEQTVRLDPGFPGAHARIAEAAWREGDLAKARRHYESELLINGKDVAALTDYGELLIQLGQSEQAERRLRKALEIEPDHAAAYFHLAQIALARKDYAEARQKFQLVLDLDPDYGGAHAAIARTLIAEDQIDQAARHLVREIRRSSGDPDALHEVGELLIQARMARQAQNLFRRLVRMCPNDAYAHHNLAVSCFLTDHVDEGIEHCRLALEHKPEYPLAMYNLALAYLERGDLLEARRLAEQALALAPADEHIQALARRVQPKGFWGRLVARLKRPTPRR